MQLQIAASYQPKEDEVWVDFRSTEDDLITSTVADTVQFNLLVEAKNLIGSVSYLPLSNLSVNSTYLRPDKNYEIKFRNPPNKMDLWVEVNATYGATTYQKRVLVGIANSSHNSMDLSDNVITTQNQFYPQLAGGGDDTEFNENIVVLAPEIRDYIKVYDFTTAAPVEDFENLVYLGGGNRLLINNQSNQFEFQTVDQAPWTVSSFSFLETGGNNFLPNPFFQTVTSSSDSPVGYKVKLDNCLISQNVDFNYQITSAAKIWTIRLQQNTIVNSFNEAVVSLLNPITCVAFNNYTLSVYSKIRPLNKTTKVTKYTLALKWYDITNIFISEDTVDLNPNAFSDMNLAVFSCQAPAGSAFVSPELRLGSIDSGDDVELSLLGLQLEYGKYATTRMNGIRLQDEITLTEYDASNQKIRLEMVAGFNSGIQDMSFLTGPINASFKASGDIEVFIPDAAVTLSTPFMPFGPGDLLDITFEHQAGKKLSIYLDGQLLADTPLPSFSTVASPLTILGTGVELLKLSVFSRQGG